MSVRQTLRMLRTRTPRSAWRACDVEQTQQRLPTYWYTYERNFGDLLAPALIESLTGVKPTLVHCESTGKVLSIGSVLRHARAGDTVWGTGAIRDSPLSLQGVNILALRGPLSRQLAGADPLTPLGDPAMLLPDVYSPQSTGTASIGFIPHYVDLPLAATLTHDMRIIDVTRKNWRRTVDQIVSCDVVVSSSLHGIIVAEAYGIPAVWSRTVNPIAGGDFKFRDYFASTGRDLPQAIGPAIDVADARRQAIQPPVIHAEKLRDSLLDWFGALPR